MTLHHAGHLQDCKHSQAAQGENDHRADNQVDKQSADAPVYAVQPGCVGFLLAPEYLCKHDAAIARCGGNGGYGGHWRGNGHCGRFDVGHWSHLEHRHNRSPRQPVMLPADNRLQDADIAVSESARCPSCGVGSLGQEIRPGRRQVAHRVRVHAKPLGYFADCVHGRTVGAYGAYGALEHVVGWSQSIAPLAPGVQQ